MKGTGLEKAVARLDAAFAALPRTNVRGLALAIYRVWPAYRQYQRDVEGVFSDGVVEAAWGVLMSLVFVLPRGREHVADKLGAALQTRAPNLMAFCEWIARACDPERAPMEVTLAADADPKGLPPAAP